MQSDEEKAEDIKKKRRLAAKGLAERKDGKPIDPMEDVWARLTSIRTPTAPRRPRKNRKISPSVASPSASA
jgi:hypothetical protein